MRAIVTAPACRRICSGRSSSPGVLRFSVIPGEFPSCRDEGGWVEVVWAFTVARSALPRHSKCRGEGGWVEVVLGLYGRPQRLTHVVEVAETFASIAH